MSFRRLWSLIILLLTVNRIKLLRRLQVFGLTKNRCLLLLVVSATCVFGFLQYMLSPRGPWYHLELSWYGWILDLVVELMNLVINLCNISTNIYIIAKTKRMCRSLPYDAKAKLNRGNAVLFGLLAAYIADSLFDIWLQIIRLVTLNGFINIKYLLRTVRDLRFCKFIIFYDCYLDIIVTIVTALILQFSQRMRPELSAMIKDIKRCRNLFKEPGITEAQEKQCQSDHIFPITE